MPLIILENFKDLNLSAASIARKFHVSDTYVMKAASELDLLIAEYKSCEFSLFREFARLLQKHRSAIIRSFSIVLPKPREKKEFRKDTGKVRGPYKKKKRDILTYSVRYPAFFIACSTRFAAGPAAEAP